MPGPRYVAGIDFAHGRRPYQELLPLSAADASALRAVDRLERLRRAGARPMLLDATPRRHEPGLLLTGPKEAVGAAKEVLRQLLDRESAVSVALHPEDARTLRKPSRAVVPELERMSGCRFVVSSAKQHQVSDPILERQQPHVELLGDAASKARALQLLAGCCHHLALPEDCGRWLCGFDAATLGVGVALSAGGRGVRRIADDTRRCPRGCVASGSGQVRQYGRGSFFCLQVAKVSSTKRLSDGFRVGVTPRPLSEQLESLMTRPRPSWVLGGGQVRGPTGRSTPFPSAAFDGLAEGDTLGFLVTLTGQVVIDLLPAGEETTWKRLLLWEAQVPDPSSCFVVVELAGRISEVQLVDLPPPPADEVVPQEAADVVAEEGAPEVLSPPSIAELGAA